MASLTSLDMPVLKSRRAPTREGRGFYIRTFGCQMNKHDSERIRGLLEMDGMHSVSRVEVADVIVLNTCTIRENADQRLFGYLGSLKRIKLDRPGLQIVVGGCLAQNERDAIRERSPWVDVVFGTHNTHRVLDLLDHAEEWGSITEIWDETVSIDNIPSTLPVTRKSDHSAWVTITIGCNNSCTFCIVPTVRGREISRRPGDVVGEMRRLAANGVVEATLLGQNVNSYGRDLELNGRRPLFADLLRRVGEVDGIRRIRFASPHPKDFKADVADAMADTEAVCEQLHLPLQSGSDRILAAMHRGYDAERFLAKLVLARDTVADLTVSTDIIVGFPGETDTDFEATLDIVAEAQFDSAFMFQFSPRPGTPAAGYGDQVPTQVVQERFGRLVDLQNAITYRRNADQVGHRAEVMAEGPSKRDASMTTGRTRGNRIVHVPGAFDAGSVFDVDILRAGKHHLIGSPI